MSMSISFSSERVGSSVLVAELEHNALLSCISVSAMLIRLEDDGSSDSVELRSLLCFPPFLPFIYLYLVEGRCLFLE